MSPDLLSIIVLALLVPPLYWLAFAWGWARLRLPAPTSDPFGL